MQNLAYKIGNRLAGKSEYLLNTYQLTEFIFRIEAKCSAVVSSMNLTSYLNLENTTFCVLRFFSYTFTASDGSEESTATVWYHLVLSWCTMVSEVKRRGAHESKNINYAKQHHTPHC